MRIPVKQIAFLVALVMVAVIGAQAQRSPVKVVTHAVVGEIKKVDRETGKIILKTAEGVGETLHLTERATIDSGKGVMKGTEYVAQKGERVTVHYTEAGGHKAVHLLKRLGKAVY